MGLVSYSRPNRSADEEEISEETGAMFSSLDLDKTNRKRKAHVVISHQLPNLKAAGIKLDSF